VDELSEILVHVCRVSASYTYSANACLTGALNCCPCGYYGDLFRQCTCSSTAVAKYQKRIPGPLLNRIDLHIEVPRLSEEEMLQASRGEPSSAIRDRVCRARAMQAARFATPLPPTDPADAVEPPHPADAAAELTTRPKRAKPLFCNAQMGPKEIRAYCTPSEPVKALLRAAIQQLGLSARAYDRLLKVARTIADLGGEADIKPPHVAEAIQYRSLDRKLWSA
jgi:magnesium chelatase family protein